jgi:hypothetical protein
MMRKITLLFSYFNCFSWVATVFAQPGTLPAQYPYAQAFDSLAAISISLKAKEVGLMVTFLELTLVQ